MKLKSLGINLPEVTKILFIGEPEITTATSTEGEPYYAWGLKDPITVRCSSDKYVEPLTEVTELYLRQSALERDDWKGSKEDGLYLEGWVADFSKGQEFPIYQAETIRKWTKMNREERTRDKTGTLNQRMKERAEKLAKKELESVENKKE